MTRFIVASLAILVAARCAPPVVTSTAQLPARFPRVALLQRVAVLPFDGRDGATFAAELEASLASIQVDGRQYFTLVDRAGLDRSIGELRLSASGLVDPAKAAQVGKMAGARGIYGGVITAPMVSDSGYTENRQECARYDETKKTFIKPCLQWNKYAVSCTRRSATFSFAPRLVEVESGTVVYSRSIVGKASASGCQDSNVPLATRADLLEKAKDSAMADFLRDIAPYSVTFKLELRESAEGINSTEARLKLSNGVAYAKQGGLERACELWEEALALAPAGVSLVYNLGSCAEARGELAVALDRYRKADKLLGRPERRITEAVARVSKTVEAQRRGQGR